MAPLAKKDVAFVGALLAAALLAPPLGASPSSADAPASPAPASPACAQAPAPSPPSLMLPPLVPGITRVYGSVRPFFNLAGAGFGAFSDLAIDHYFHQPVKLGVELSPLALVVVPEGVGAIAHIRVRAAVVTDYIEVGAGVGGRLQHFGPSGWSIAPAIRLGALDGINLRAELSSAVIRNYYTSRVELALSHVHGGLDVPFTRRLAATIDGGFGLDLWGYFTLGLRHIVTGDGGPGTLAVGGSLGAVWIVDHYPCQYGDSEPCRGAAWGAGPTIAFRVDRRF